MDLEWNKLYLGDCMDYMREMPDKYVNLAIVDPPYGIGVAKLAYTQEDNRPCKQKNGSVLHVKKLKYAHKDWDNTPPTKEYFDELFRVSKNQIIWGVNYFDLPNIGTGRIKWDKGVPDGVSFSRYEYAYCSMIDKEVLLPLLWTGFSQAVNLSEPMRQQGNKQLNEKRIHPTHKPILLYKNLIRTYAHPGDKIIDTHVGSGSSIIAFIDGGFDWIGFEIDSDYHRDATKRINNHVKQTDLLNPEKEKYIQTDLF